jgi:hypothetical protein
MVIEPAEIQTAFLLSVKEENTQMKAYCSHMLLKKVNENIKMNKKASKKQN